MTVAPDPLDHGWWIASRSAGVVALIAVTLSVIFGLLMANGLPRRKGAMRVMIALHESTALAGLVAISVHGIALLGDPWMHPTVKQIAIPFTIAYRPFWTGLGHHRRVHRGAPGPELLRAQAHRAAPLAPGPPRHDPRLGARRGAHHRRAAPTAASAGCR